MKSQYGKPVIRSWHRAHSSVSFFLVGSSLNSIASEGTLRGTQFGDHYTYTITHMLPKYTWSSYCARRLGLETICSIQGKQNVMFTVYNNLSLVRGKQITQFEIT